MSLRELSAQSSAHSDAIWSIDWSNASQIATGGVDELMKAWSVNAEGSGVESKPRLIASAQSLLKPDAVLPVSASLSLLSVIAIPNTPLILTSSMDGVIRVYDTEKLEARRIDAGPLECWTAAVDPTGTFVATGSQKGHVNVFEIATGEKKAVLAGDKAKEGEAAGAWVMSVAWSADGRHLAAGHFDGRITLFSMQGPQAAAAPKPLTPHTKAVRTLKFSPDSSLLFSGSDDTHVHWYETAAGTGQLLHDLSAHSSWVTGIDIPKTSPASSSASSGTGGVSNFSTVSSDKKLKIWNISTKECVAVHELDSSAWCVAFDTTGEKIAVGTEQGTLAILKVSVQ